MVGHLSGTLVNGLLYHYGDNLSTVNIEFRPVLFTVLIGLGAYCKMIMHTNCLLYSSKTIVLENIMPYVTMLLAKGTIDAPIGRHPVVERMSINYENGRTD